ncbi:DNA polymerase delta subunit 3 [Marchantia polymorpha subsp. ruderalis]|uniref:DNA polymerase delta subunit 3 n=2 Tax=Marchantia polymorpha TaxID=3197 RepID=A0A176VLI3_MARPO|nr:hypothetical protein AXG93_3506s1010 [Marchantia polymorpha subsp. ruderalis]PTQ46465.1 hypothetical protein MARPO_0011s0137 [Marchantia polymorpha]PTQ46466.1 hypothetical protein MARPO_0011s0137 [Marchantia polymorpha]BBN08429.1 hypothetical protein Mp_4g11520 [Marchantia polymorpha subsp. ruderalis]BBN08430.1 hypothetical protein Mp_4g11520 [Marchantia polymorpha subsp. ruderalis]|eukprot:PTQ46465.1 hypothetical protein MARPO_0011s0137 [Marchantia polymorpha]
MEESPSSQVLFEIEGLILDALQVISYKWLSRKFSIPSNMAKRLLERFVSQNKQLDLEVVYAVSGWTKQEPQCYSVQLVPKSKLEDVKASLKENPSVHVYSVQRCLPKDPAQLWSADFVQAVELFNQPQDVNNSLRDNRFSAVSCTLVQRSLLRKTSGSTSSQQQIPVAAAKPISTPRGPVQNAAQPSHISRSTTADRKPVKSEIPPVPPISALSHHAKDVIADIKPVKTEIPSVQSVSPQHDAKDTALGKNGSKIVVLPPAGKRKAMASVPLGGANGGSSISNLWGKAASKPSATSHSKELEPPVEVAGDAEARIQAMEADGFSDEDVDPYVSTRVKRTAGRRRMIVEDDDSGNEGAEEDEEMIVRLGTPDSPQDVKPLLWNGHDRSMVPKDQISEVNAKSSTLEMKVSSNLVQDKNGLASNIQPAMKDKVVQKSNVVEQDVPGFRAGIKRKKVMKTRIDEKGREVTEVVWVTEGEDTASADEKPPLVTAKPSAPTNKESDTKASTERTRALPKPQPAPPKAPASKGGKSATKATGKQQGSIMSFFKKQ